MAAFFDRAWVTKIAKHSHCESAGTELLRLESIQGSEMTLVKGTQSVLGPRLLGH